MKYRIGQKVKVKETGEVFEIVDINAYLYGRLVNGGFIYYNESELSPLEKSFDNPEVGDVYLDEDGDERTVLGVCGRAIFLSQHNNPNFYSSGYTKEDLIEYGYTIKQDTSDATQEAVELLKKNGYKVVKE